MGRLDLCIIGMDLLQIYILLKFESRCHTVRICTLASRLYNNFVRSRAMHGPFDLTEIVPFVHLQFRTLDKKAIQHENATRILCMLIFGHFIYMYACIWLFI